MTRQPTKGSKGGDKDAARIATRYAHSPREEDQQPGEPEHEPAENQSASALSIKEPTVAAIIGRPPARPPPSSI